MLINYTKKALETHMPLFESQNKSVSNIPCQDKINLKAIFNAKADANLSCSGVMFRFLLYFLQCISIKKVNAQSCLTSEPEIKTEKHKVGIGTTHDTCWVSAFTI